jgi:hypothetical protein
MSAESSPPFAWKKWGVRLLILVPIKIAVVLALVNVFDLDFGFW